MPAPTPEQIRQDQTVPWQTTRVHAAGKWHDFRVKTVCHLRWRATGDSHDLRLVVIAPLGYRPCKGSRLLYRKPAYLICTDTELPLDKLIQAYGAKAMPNLLPPPKWRQHLDGQRVTTNSLIQQLRAELWGKALGITNFSDFAVQPDSFTMSDKITPNLKSAVLYA